MLTKSTNMETKSQTIEKCPKLPPASYTMLTCHSVINIVMNALTNIVLRGGGGGGGGLSRYHETDESCIK